MDRYIAPFEPMWGGPPLNFLSALRRDATLPFEERPLLLLLGVIESVGSGMGTVEDGKSTTDLTPLPLAPRNEAAAPDLARVMASLLRSYLCKHDQTT